MQIHIIWSVCGRCFLAGRRAVLLILLRQGRSMMIRNFFMWADKGLNRCLWIRAKSLSLIMSVSSSSSHSCLIPQGCPSLSGPLVFLPLPPSVSFFSIHHFHWASGSCNPPAKNQTVVPTAWLAHKATRMLIHTLTHTHTWMVPVPPRDCSIRPPPHRQQYGLNIGHYAGICKQNSQ